MLDKRTEYRLSRVWVIVPEVSPTIPLTPRPSIEPTTEEEEEIPEDTLGSITDFPDWSPFFTVFLEDQLTKMSLELMRRRMSRAGIDPRAEC